MPTCVSSSNFDRDLRVRLEISYPICSLAATSEQIHLPLVRGEPDLDSMGSAATLPDCGQVRILLVGTSRKPLSRASHCVGHLAPLLVFAHAGAEYQGITPPRRPLANNFNGDGLAGELASYPLDRL